LHIKSVAPEIFLSSVVDWNLAVLVKDSGQQTRIVVAPNVAIVVFHEVARKRMVLKHFFSLTDLLHRKQVYSLVILLEIHDCSIPKIME
jgi:hypothetical protein